MAVEITRATRSFLASVADAPEALRSQIIAFHAQSSGMDPDDLMAALAGVKADAAKKKADAAKKAENKAAGAKDESVRTLILSFNLDSERSDVLAAVSYATARKKRVWVNDDGSFDTNLKASKRGNGGGNGRPKSTDSTGLIDVETGDEILGGVITFVKANVETFGDDLLDDLFTKDKEGDRTANYRQRNVVIAALLKHEIVERVED